jgi:hypothetical protein
VIACDTNQLHRFERSIAALECRSEVEQMPPSCLRPMIFG